MCIYIKIDTYLFYFLSFPFLKIKGAGRRHSHSCPRKSPDGGGGYVASANAAVGDPTGAYAGGWACRWSEPVSASVAGGCC